MLRTISAVMLLIFAGSLFAQGECDSTLWKHVYNPSRLRVILICQSVKGTKVDATNGQQKDGCLPQADGDLRCWLKLDHKQTVSINLKNTQSDDGNLVFQPMCQQTPTRADVVASGVCQGWSQVLLDAPIGAHIEITGSWIMDKDDGEMKMHPVSSITVIP